MTWVKDEMDRRKRHKDLPRHAEELSDDLWDEMVERVHEAADDDMPVIVEGEQIIIKGVPPKTLTVRVSKDERSIEASNGVVLPLGYDGNSPSFMHPSSGNPIPVEEAARLILEPFLFAD